MRWRDKIHKLRISLRHILRPTRHNKLISHFPAATVTSSTTSSCVAAAAGLHRHLTSYYNSIRPGTETGRKSKAQTVPDPPKGHPLLILSHYYIYRCEYYNSYTHTWERERASPGWMTIFPIYAPLLHSSSTPCKTNSLHFVITFLYPIYFLYLGSLVPFDLAHSSKEHICIKF